MVEEGARHKYGLPYSNIYVTIPPLTWKFLEREGWRGSSVVVEVNLVAEVKYLARLRRATPPEGGETVLLQAVSPRAKRRLSGDWS